MKHLTTAQWNQTPADYKTSKKTVGTDGKAHFDRKVLTMTERGTALVEAHLTSKFGYCPTCQESFLAEMKKG